jgi:SAM-dependent MidA family methyltransferase
MGARVSRPELAPAARAAAEGLPEGARHAVSLEAPAWIEAAAAKVLSGWVLTIDYGKRFAPGTPNPPRAFRRHRVESQLSAAPGAQDLTASVDFEAVIAAGERSGLALESYESMAKFLLDGGIESWFKACEGEDAAAFKERAQLKTLIHPEAMGEAFKVLIQRKN